MPALSPSGLPELERAIDALDRALSGVERDEARKALRERYDWYVKHRQPHGQREAENFAARERQRYENHNNAEPDLDQEVGLPRT